MNSISIQWSIQSETAAPLIAWVAMISGLLSFVSTFIFDFVSRLFSYMMSGVDASYACEKGA